VQASSISVQAVWAFGARHNRFIDMKGSAFVHFLVVEMLPAWMIAMA